MMKGDTTMTKDIEMMLEKIEEHEIDMTEEELFNAYVDILMLEDIDWDTLTSLPIYYFPMDSYEDEYGHVHEECGKPELNGRYKKIFTKAHAKNLLSLLDECIDDLFGGDY